MSDIAIKAEGLGKSYRIGQQGRRERYTALRDVLANGTRRALDRTRRLFRGQFDLTTKKTEEFWALRDVTFDVKHGEVLGIIGRNGAGKSTLLKVLSRITEPTEGRVTLRGRVASLLEVGTGFHPELSGRENVFLNGAILGMKGAEIKRKFDEIVAFAEVEKFLDTPVKRYSSGMYVRLAFAVAAHLEPEILVVDEVLAVGDAEFQKKCLGKMGDVAQKGRTVLFVTHQLSMLTALCPNSMLLNCGEVERYGETRDLVAHYLTCMVDSSDCALQDRRDIRGNRAVEVLELRIVTNNEDTRTIVSGSGTQFVIEYRLTVAPPAKVSFVLAIRDTWGRPVTAFNTRFAQGTLSLASRGVVVCEVPCLPLVAGQYTVDLYTLTEGTNLGGGDLAFHLRDAVRFRVESNVAVNSSLMQDAAHAGVLALQQVWTHTTNTPNVPTIA